MKKFCEQTTEMLNQLMMHDDGFNHLEDEEIIKAMACHYFCNVIAPSKAVAKTYSHSKSRTEADTEINRILKNGDYEDMQMLSKHLSNMLADLRTMNNDLFNNFVAKIKGVA